MLRHEKMIHILACFPNTQVEGNLGYSDFGANWATGTRAVSQLALKLGLVFKIELP